MAKQYAVQQRHRKKAEGGWEFPDPYEDPWEEVSEDYARRSLQIAREVSGAHFVHRLLVREVSEPTVLEGP